MELDPGAPFAIRTRQHLSLSLEPTGPQHRAVDRVLAALVSCYSAASMFFPRVDAFLLVLVPSQSQHSAHTRMRIIVRITHRVA